MRRTIFPAVLGNRVAFVDGVPAAADGAARGTRATAG